MTQSDVAAGRVTNTANATALDPATSAITANSASASSTTLLLAVTGVVLGLLPYLAVLAIVFGAVLWWRRRATVASPK